MNERRGPILQGATDRSHELLRLASADNFRDVAGPGHPTRDGTRVRGGVFYRTNELQLTEADAASLAGLGIRAILDLRGQPEVDAHPDVEVPGATWEHVEVSSIPTEMGEGLVDSDAAHRVCGRCTTVSSARPTRERRTPEC